MWVVSTSSMPGRLGRVVVVVALALAWTSLFWFVPPQRAFPVVDAAADAVSDAVRAATGLRAPWLWVAKSTLLAGGVVVVVALWQGRHRTGLALPAGPGLGLFAVAVVVALPFQIALGLDDAVARYYRSFFGPRGHEWIVANAVVMLVEHAFIEGVVLSLALSGGLPPVDERPRRGLRGLPWLGALGLGPLVDPTRAGPRTLLAVPIDAWPALIGQGFVFGCIHFTKAPSELVTAFPGGVAVGWLTVRTGSIWPAALLHLVTGAVVFTTLRATRP
ncbi:MAG: CPBP family intramembrane metalloprotease [Deltaproteobacteria bacterium]|nr:CPBP family intramembrane metalloprotease [Deltaproteobacteria bacterium]